MSKRLENPDVSAEISSALADEMKAIVADAAGPRAWTDTIESMLWRAHKALGLPQRRVKAMWYREPYRLSAAEYLHCKKVHAELVARRERQEAIHAAHKDQAVVLDRPGRVGGQPLGAGETRCADGSGEA